MKQFYNLGVKFHAFTEWGVYYKGGELLDWDVQPFYKIKVKCTDTSTPGKEGPEREMHVHVKKNEPPVYNVPGI